MEQPRQHRGHHHEIGERADTGGRPVPPEVLALGQQDQQQEGGSVQEAEGVGLQRGNSGGTVARGKDITRRGYGGAGQCEREPDPNAVVDRLQLGEEDQRHAEDPQRPAGQHLPFQGPTEEQCRVDGGEQHLGRENHRHEAGGHVGRGGVQQAVAAGEVVPRPNAARAKWLRQPCTRGWPARRTRAKKTRSAGSSLWISEASGTTVPSCNRTAWKFAPQTRTQNRYIAAVDRVRNPLGPASVSPKVMIARSLSLASVWGRRQRGESRRLRQRAPAYRFACSQGGSRLIAGILLRFCSRKWIMRRP